MGTEHTSQLHVKWKVNEALWFFMVQMSFGLSVRRVNDLLAAWGVAQAGVKHCCGILAAG